MKLHSNRASSVVNEASSVVNEFKRTNNHGDVTYFLSVLPVQQLSLQLVLVLGQVQDRQAGCMEEVVAEEEGEDRVEQDMLEVELERDLGQDLEREQEESQA